MMPALILHRRQLVATAGAALLLAACGKEEPPGGAVVALTVTGGPGLNSGENRPVTLRLLRLKDPGPFLVATYASMQDPATALGPALLGMSELVVGNAGDTVAQTVTMEPEATTLGLMAMLMDPSGRTWSATVPTPPGAMVTANATLRPSGLAVTTGG
jgi:type VI secretion system protein VasD